MDRCYCGSNKSYPQCCQLLHLGMQKAATAEQLMRSRYSAFVVKNEAYLRQTWVDELCPQNLALDASPKWLRLEILNTYQGAEKDETGKVEFKAWFIEDDMLLCLHEKSDFVKHLSEWLYHSGELIDEPAEAISRNQECPCGSGKKYKRCCL